MDTYTSLPKPFFVLAPMDDVTDTVFRQMIADCAPPDLYFTEFANVDGLQSPGRPRLLKKLKHASRDQPGVISDQPLVAHIWGKNPDNFYKTAQQIASGELGNFVGIDLNMGCPVKTVVGHGVCSALIKDRPLAHDIIQAVQDGVAGSNRTLPVSVKTRLGYGQVDLTWHEFLLGHNLDMLTVHGRTRAQMSKVPADWELIGEVRQLRDRLSPDTLVVGNGDVLSRGHGIELAEKYGLDGIMIGRGVFHDPFVFAEASPWDTVPERQRIELFSRHVDLFAATWQEGERPIHTLNKFCKIYINGFDGAKELREQFMAADSIRQLQEMITDAVKPPVKNFTK
ncbi:MAG TPA: tRNA-dihydrouridine synthase [Candidatus Saccharimonadales bacterium]|nr:tRNA-dihydrouridine synthase [Candidatus Saccharimonadales bacterium]